MNIRFITPTWHGLVDYLAAVELLMMPFVLRLGASAPLANGLPSPLASQSSWSACSPTTN